MNTQPNGLPPLPPTCHECGLPCGTNHECAFCRARNRRIFECRHHVLIEDRCPDCEAMTVDVEMEPEHFALLEAAEMIANDYKDDCLNGSEYVAVSRMGFNCLMEVLKAQTSARVGSSTGSVKPTEGVTASRQSQEEWQRQQRVDGRKEEFRERLADLMVEHGPDRHCDGYEIIADALWEEFNVGD